MHELTRSGSIQAAGSAQWHVRALQFLTVILTDYKLPVLCTSLQVDLQTESQAARVLRAGNIGHFCACHATTWKVSTAHRGHISKQEWLPQEKRVMQPAGYILLSKSETLSTDQASTRNLILQCCHDNMLNPSTLFLARQKDLAHARPGPRSPGSDA